MTGAPLTATASVLEPAVYDANSRGRAENTGAALTVAASVRCGAGAADLPLACARGKRAAGDRQEPRARLSAGVWREIQSAKAND
jgi:hypothetical protein